MDPIETPIFGQPIEQHSWRVEETVMELNDRPHLLLRVEVRGPLFPIRNAQAFVQLVGQTGSVRSLFADVTEDGAAMVGYFSVDAPAEDSTIEYGYGNTILGRIQPTRLKEIDRLDRNRLPEDLIVLTESEVRRIQTGQTQPK